MVIEDLNFRLENSRPLTPTFEGVQHQYGIGTRLLEDFITFWKTKYDWRRREKFLNKYPQFTTNIQGLNIHFLHVKPENASELKVLPVLIMHGWPSSVREFYELIPMLTQAREGHDFVFEVVAPSLPGYTFSDGSAKPGLGAAAIAVIFKNLMVRLGFEEFYVHGGDWGGAVVFNMVALFPEYVLGGHSTMCLNNSPMGVLIHLLGALYPPLVVDEKYEHKLYPLSSFLEYYWTEFGYLHIQSTKPDTIGVGLDDSPIGLAAYILEKVMIWTDPGWVHREDGGIKSKFTYDSLLDNIMIYWVTKTMTNSMRLYANTFNKAEMGLRVSSISVHVPFACARFQHDLFYTPDSVLKMNYKNLVQTSDVEGGGHFPAFEAPHLLAEDIWKAVGKMQDHHLRNNL